MGNALKTTLLLGAMTGLILFIGGLMGGSRGIEMAFIFAAGSPEGCPCSAAFLLAAVRISLYAFGSTIAIFCWGSSNARITAKPRSSSPASVRSPLRNPCRTFGWVGAKEAGRIQDLSARHSVILT